MKTQMPAAITAYPATLDSRSNLNVTQKYHLSDICRTHANAA